MAIIIPEIIFKNNLEALLTHYCEDVVERLAANEKEKSLLYDIFGDLKFEQLSYFDQMRDILINRSKTGSGRRQLSVTLGYDMNRNNYPNISIILPSEEQTNKRISAANQDIVTETSYGRENISGNDVMYNLLITSDNANEVIILYHFVKTLFLSAIDQWTLNGMQNLSVSGRDITVDLDGAPAPHVFHRTVAVRFFYENKVLDINRFEAATDFKAEGTIIG